MRIFDWAVVASWDERLQTLAEMAEPERWKYISCPSEHELPILESYVRHTFRRAAAQHRIVETDRAACFNTGLLTPSHEQIFAYFTPSEQYDPEKPVSGNNKKWWLKGWDRSGDRVLTQFRDLPRLVTYWTDPGELIFNPALEVQLNLDHIVRENLSRFPVELGGAVDQSGVPTDLVGDEDAEDDVEDEAFDEEVAPQEEHNDTPVPIVTRNALEGAMKHSIRLAKRSYRVAVPQFHYGQIQLLLPVYLRDSDRPDLALTLEKHGEWYRAATVLYPDWAYNHARLLSRPNSEWLGGFRSDLDVVSD